MMANTSPIGVPRLMPDQAAPSSVVSPILKSRPPKSIPVATPNKAANKAAMPEIITATITPRTSSLSSNFPVSRGTLSQARRYAASFCFSHYAKRTLL
jgi:hypothetical protein